MLGGIPMILIADLIKCINSPIIVPKNIIVKIGYYK